MPKHRVPTSVDVALQLALAALARVRPQARGVLVQMDIDEAIAAIHEVLPKHLVPKDLVRP